MLCFGKLTSEHNNKKKNTLKIFGFMGVYL